jgi:glycosyltransferase involved in cell wall biosynthesis
MKEVSLLIPTHKPGDYILNCLNSIEQQSISKDFYKVYIALNGPKEPYFMFLKSLLNNYSFQYEFIYLETPNVSCARNHLIDISSEAFIAFIDDDDMISTCYIEELVKVADDFQISISNSFNYKIELDNIEPNHLGKSFCKLDFSESSLYKTRKYFSPVYAKLISRNIIGSVRFNQKINIGEDSLFMAEISPFVKGINKALTNTACYYINQRVGSVTRKKMNKIKELKRIVFILFFYTRMLLSGKYDKIFIVSRIAATFKHHLKEVIIN